MVSEKWTLQAWIKPSQIAPGRTLIAGLAGEAGSGPLLVAQNGRVGVIDNRAVLSSRAPLKAGSWTFVAAVSDGARLRLVVDGRQVGEARPSAARAWGAVQLAPRLGEAPFAGRIAGFIASNEALSQATLAAAAKTAPDDSLINFESGSPTWAVQTKAMAGQLTSQDAWTLPWSKAMPSPAVARCSRSPSSGVVLANSGISGPD